MEPLGEFVKVQQQVWNEARSGLVLVESFGEPTLEQRCARYLSRCGQAMQPGELRDAFAGKNFGVSAAALRRTMQNHPAFVRQPGDRYVVGRRVLPQVN